ncbi:carboxymuconolactone decarboxylase family protein [Microbacterium aurantiacum]|uniref:Carboxymuconolactone decarboxylase family protein n=1 Tax=Microbacterium aurantiacum TaxID=162393 RepID=A0ABT8FWY7_9MICO|nr:carboxymuconolactone decarboxylase family protein [Microbacterium aurantiacum]MDN4465397.1 carboxymuconolactone decarboxylase family protein [Microbacterium aurantiacum]
MDIDDRRAKGEQLQERMRPRMTAHLASRFTGPAADFGRYSTEILFGEMWQRGGLDIRSREIAVLSALIAQREMRDLRVHVPIALNLGLTRDEIYEIVYQLALYVGWPRAGEVFALLDEVFEGID